MFVLPFWELVGSEPRLDVGDFQLLLDLLSTDWLGKDDVLTYESVDLEPRLEMGDLQLSPDRQHLCMKMYCHECPLLL